MMYASDDPVKEADNEFESVKLKINIVCVKVSEYVNSNKFLIFICLYCDKNILRSNSNVFNSL